MNSLRLLLIILPLVLLIGLKVPHQDSSELWIAVLAISTLMGPVFGFVFCWLLFLKIMVKRNLTKRLSAHRYGKEMRPLMLLMQTIISVLSSAMVLMVLAAVSATYQYFPAIVIHQMFMMSVALCVITAINFYLCLKRVGKINVVLE